MDPLFSAGPKQYRTRRQLEDQERANLARYAQLSAATRGRDYPSEPHPYRTEYQKDRDRIMYTTAFRRLQYKTQVFIYYEGDYYRTRLTHTNEAAQIARTVARALGVNEDLAEAITLAHDLGHPPFGHSGERALDQLVLERMGVDPDDEQHRGRGFNHNLQSLRIVTELEQRWSGHRGLNLTWETREGIVKHATEYDHVASDWLAPYEPGLRPSLEAQIVNFADELTYSAHDLDDGLRSGMIRLGAPELEDLGIWRAASDGVTDVDEELRRHRVIRRVIDLLITDLVRTSAAAVEAANLASADGVRRHPVPLVGLSGDVRSMHGDLKAFLYERLYRHWRVVRVFRKAQRVLQALFEAFEEDYRQLPHRQQASVLVAQPDADEAGELNMDAYRVITDYIAGMTDRYALQEYRRLYDPYERA